MSTETSTVEQLRAYIREQFPSLKDFFQPLPHSVPARALDLGLHSREASRVWNEEKADRIRERLELIADRLPILLDYFRTPLDWQRRHAIAAASLAAGTGLGVEAFGGMATMFRLMAPTAGSWFKVFPPYPWPIREVTPNNRRAKALRAEVEHQERQVQRCLGLVEDHRRKLAEATARLAALESRC